jgi:hypothetical protein
MRATVFRAKPFLDEHAHLGVTWVVEDDHRPEELEGRGRCLAERDAGCRRECMGCPALRPLSIEMVRKSGIDPSLPLGRSIEVIRAT